MARSRGRQDTTPSATRAESLRGRKSLRNGAKQMPVQSRVGLVSRRPQPDPDLKRLPRDRFTAVFPKRTPKNATQLELPLLTICCADCKDMLAIDLTLKRLVKSMPERDRRPMNYLCKQCFWEYFEGFYDKLKWSTDTPCNTN